VGARRSGLERCGAKPHAEPGRAARHSAPLYRLRRSSFGFCQRVYIRKIRSDAKVPFPMCRKSRFQHGELVYFARRLPAMGLRRHRNIIPHRGVLKIYESRLLLKHVHIHIVTECGCGGGEYTPWCTSVAN
jgi:hypothetical protein